MEQSHPTYQLSFGGLLLLLGELFQYLLRQWKWIALITFIFGAIGYYLAHQSAKIYKAKLTFMVNEQEGGPSPVDNILGNLGLDRPGGSKHNLPKILELSKSMYIIQKVLLRQGRVNEKEDFFANHIIQQFNLHNNWTNIEGLKSFLFNKNDFNSFNETERKALKLLFNKIIGTEMVDGAFSNSLSNDSQIMTLKFDSPSEDLSVQFLLAIFEELSSYYVEKSTEKQEATYQSVLVETDSIEQKLKVAEYQLARFQDTRQDLVSQRARLDRNRLLREVTLYSTIYGESIKNLELAKFNLKQRTPFIQSIDLPFKPLSPSKASTLKYALLAALAGGFLSIILLLCYKIVVDAIQKEKALISKQLL